MPNSPIPLLSENGQQLFRQRTFRPPATNRPKRQVHGEKTGFVNFEGIFKDFSEWLCGLASYLQEYFLR
jgi:hypothetical protein